MMFTLQNRCFLRRVARLIAWLSPADSSIFRMRSMRPIQSHGHTVPLTDS
jgi:hypothetical protein